MLEFSMFDFKIAKSDSAVGALPPDPSTVLD